MAKTAEQKQDDRPRRGELINCRNCNSSNWERYMRCFNCHCILDPEDTKSFVFGYKVGKNFMGQKQHQKIMMEAIGHEADYLQPYKYDKTEKKMVKNKDFVKKYGDPDKLTENKTNRTYD